MSSEFHQLSDKVEQLAALAQSLRRENADLRLQLTAMTTENAVLAQRIDEAHQRVSQLLQQLPAAALLRP